MAIGFFKFVKGVLLNGESSDPSDNLNGSMWHNSSSNRIKSYVESAVREVVTNSQGQTLTNKTIDADSNTITNIENADIKAGAAIDATKIGSGTVSNTEFGYLDGVTSALQTQLNNKANSSNPSLSNPTIDVEILSHQTTPSNPSSGFVKVYAKNDDKIYKLNSAGTEVELGASSGANTTLSNLSSPVAINQDVLPDTTNTRSLGSALKTFTNLILNKIKLYSSVSTYWTGTTQAILVDNDASPSVEFTIGSKDAASSTEATKYVTLISGAQEDVGSSVATGRVTLWTGDHYGTGATGDIVMYTGWNYSNSGATGAFSLGSGNSSNGTGATGAGIIETGAINAAGSSANTGSITIKTGSTSGTGNSGSITLQTGTSSGGARGQLNILAARVDFGSAPIKKLNDIESASGQGLNLSTLDSNTNITLNPHGTGVVDVSTSRITNLSDPTSAQDAATKNYVDAIAVTSKTANYTATTSDQVIKCDASGGAFTITLYAASGNSGRRLIIKKTDTSFNTVTIDANGSETIDGDLTKKLATEDDTLTLVCDGSNWQVVSRTYAQKWTTFTSVITGATSNPTKGTTTRDYIAWYREGKNMLIHFEYIQTGSGTSGSGDYRLGLPSGVTIDTNVISAANSAPRGYVGDAVHVYGGANAMGTLKFLARSSTDLWAIYYAGGYSGAAFSWSSSNLSLATANNQICGTFRVPITDWDV